MQFHEMDIIGEHTIQTVTSPDIATYSSSDKRRFVYNSTLDTVVIGTNTKWVPFYGVGEINVSGQSDINANARADVLTFVNGNGITFTPNPTAKSLSLSTSYSFGRIVASGLSIQTIVAGDTFIFDTPGIQSGFNIFTNPTTRTVSLYAFPSWGSVAVTGQSSILMGYPSGSYTTRMLTFAAASPSVTVVSNTTSRTITIDAGATADGFFTDGRRMWLYENTAPSGWNIIYGTADSLVAIKGGTGGIASYNNTGGYLWGLWIQTAHTHAEYPHNHNGPSHTHTVGTHSHTVYGVCPSIAETPLHYHTYPDRTVLVGGGGEVGVSRQGNVAGQLSDLTSLSSGQYDYATSTLNPGGAVHSHISGTAAATMTNQVDVSTFTPAGYVSTAAYEPNTWRPYAHVGILCERASGSIPVNVERTVTVTSSGETPAGILVKIYPIDNLGRTDGYTNQGISRKWYNGTIASFIAPMVVGTSYAFQKWTLGGVDYTTDSMATVTIDNNYTLNAVYVNTASAVLTIDSSIPSTYIDVSPADLDGNSGGTT